MDASPMPVNSGASERMVARHFSGKLSADPAFANCTFCKRGIARGGSAPF